MKGNYQYDKQITFVDSLWDDILSSLYESAHRIAFQNSDPKIRQDILENHIGGLHSTSLNLPKLMTKIRSPKNVISQLDMRMDELNRHIVQFIRDWEVEHGSARTLNPEVDYRQVNTFIDALGDLGFQVHQTLVRKQIEQQIYQHSSGENQSNPISNQIFHQMDKYSENIFEFIDITEDLVIDNEYIYRWLAPAEYPSNGCDNPKVVDIHLAGKTVVKNNIPSMSQVLNDAIKSEQNPETGRYEYSYAMRKLLMEKFAEIDTHEPWNLIDEKEFITFVKRWQTEHSIAETHENEIQRVFDELAAGDQYISKEDLTSENSSRFKNILRLSEEGNCRSCTFDRHEDCTRKVGCLNIIDNFKPISCKMHLDVSSFGCGFRIELYAPLADDSSFRIKKIHMSEEMKLQFRTQMLGKNVDKKIISDIIGEEKGFEPRVENLLHDIRIDITFDSKETTSKSSEDIWFRAGYRSKVKLTSKKKKFHNPIERKFKIITDLLESIGRCCHPLRFKHIESLFLPENETSFNVSDQSWPILYTECDENTVQELRHITRQIANPFPHPIVEMEYPNPKFSAIIDPIAIWR